jgi:hypothetical protein
MSSQLNQVRTPKALWLDMAELAVFVAWSYFIFWQ